MSEYVSEYVDSAKELFEEHNLPWNNQTVIVLGVLLALAFLLVFLIVRSAWNLVYGWTSRSDAEGGSLILAAAPTGWLGRMDRALATWVENTGLAITPAQAVGWIALAMVTGGIAGYAPRENAWHASIGMTGGLVLVLGIFAFNTSRFRREQKTQLPDAIFMLARSVRAGQSIEQALELVGRQGGRSIAGEFRRCYNQIRFGLPVVKAMENMAQRLPLIELLALASAVAMHQQTGGNLPLVLDQLATNARDRNHFRTFIESATALGRLSAYAIALATPVILVAYVVLQPEYAQTMLQTRTGITLMVSALVLEVIGGVWLYQLQNVEP